MAISSYPSLKGFQFATILCFCILFVPVRCTFTAALEQQTEDAVTQIDTQSHLRKRMVSTATDKKQQDIVHNHRSLGKKIKWAVQQAPKIVKKPLLEKMPFPTPSPVKDIQELPAKKDVLNGSFTSSTPNPTPAPPAPKVITLGDSYSSGTGIHRDGCDYDVEYGGNPTLNGVSYLFTGNGQNTCWMETHTTPGPQYANQEGQESIFLACGGAQTEHVENQLDYLNTLYPDDYQNNWQGSTILLTAGGNDIETVGGMTWPELLIECILETSFFNGCHDESSNQVGNWNTIQNDLAALFTRLANEASGAKIRVLGYPKMMQRDPTCWSVTGVSSNEADWIDSQCVTLNNRIINAVNTAKNAHPSVDIEFVSVYNYLTVGACGNGPNNRHVHDKRLHSYFPYKTSNSSFHPSQLGYNAYFQALTNSL